MASLRNTGPGGDRLLDAAREAILSVGWRRTTLTDVARRAGVSRMTVYRSYPDMAALLGDLMTREWVTLAAGTAGDASAGASSDHDSAVASSAEGIAALVGATITALRANDLFRRIVELDPELLLPYLLDRRGRVQDAALQQLASRIAAAQEAGSVRPGDPVLLARTVTLATHGFLVSAATMVDETVTSAALDAELVDTVRRYLA